MSLRVTLWNPRFQGLWLPTYTELRKQEREAGAAISSEVVVQNRGELDAWLTAIYNETDTELSYRIHLYTCPEPWNTGFE